ncbi:MAG: hypothetical protein AB1730_05620 [Myxococcota bacterium]|jgi:hypothetical protein
MRLGVLTGGGDCPGLNAVRRALVRQLTFASLAESRKDRHVNPKGDKVRMARAMGVSFGE